MAGKIVDRLLEKMPFSNEIIDVLNEHFDLTFTKQLASEIAGQLADQGGKLKNEIVAALAENIKKEVIGEISRIDKAELLAKTMENLEINISFKRKNKRKSRKKSND